jgi:hypothetical protein
MLAEPPRRFDPVPSESDLMLSMSLAGKRIRQIFFLFLLLCGVVWVQSEISQWILRTRAQNLLADIRALDVNHSTWSDAQRVMTKWNKFAAPGAAPCNADACTYRVDLIQVLPQFFIGYPDPGVKNWLPRIIDHTGLRSVAARSGFTVEHGVVTSKWFAEQVALPVREWTLRGSEYTPDLAVSSGEFLGFPASDVGPGLHPYRRVRNWKGAYGVTAQFLPQEDPAEQTRLMDFQFTCITRFSPCLSEGDILPEAQRNLDEQEHSPGTR